MSEVYINPQLKECVLNSTVVYQNGFGEVHLGVASGDKYVGEFLMLRFYIMDLRIYMDLVVWHMLKDDATRDSWMWGKITDYLKPDMIQEAITESYNEGRAHGRGALQDEIRALLGV